MCLIYIFVLPIRCVLTLDIVTLHLSSAKNSFFVSQDWCIKCSFFLLVLSLCLPSTSDYPVIICKKRSSRVLKSLKPHTLLNNIYTIYIPLTFVGCSITPAIYSFIYPQDCNNSVLLQSVSKRHVRLFAHPYALCRRKSREAHSFSLIWHYTLLISLSAYIYFIEHFIFIYNKLHYVDGWIWGKKMYEIVVLHVCHIRVYFMLKGL